MRSLQLDLAGLVSSAKETGEAYLVLVSLDGLRLGLEARWDHGLSLELEGQIRLLPPERRVDLASLGRLLDRLRAIRDLGFYLYHYGDGWVIAIRSISLQEAAPAIEAATDLFRPEAINRRPA